MGILSWIILGLIVGLLAKFIMPGKDPGGIIITTILGIAGSFLGGLIGSFLGLGSTSQFNIKTLLLGVVGAIILLTIYRSLKKKQ
ncbi:MAG: GlsB/YeaQ/YmgE family stress response membrane protein [Desulfatiglans sp.]|nr:GlsB/YeaQ/YmgE family stress response membrane protein [Desulfatiglans sp.]